MRKTVRWLVVVAMLMTMLPMSALPAAANGGPLVPPTYIDIANFKLTDPPANCEKEYKFDSGDINAGASGTYEMTFEDVPACDGSDDVGDVTVEVTIDGRNVSFVVDGGKTGVVYVKGGPGGNLYDYRTAYPGGVTEDSGLTTPDSAFGVSHVSFCLCSDAKVKKDWEFTAPAALAGMTFKAYYTEDDPEVVADPDWVAVDLADGNMDNIWTGTSSFDEDTTIWWKWRVYDGMDLFFESMVFGPETLTAEGGPYVNDFTLVQKDWEFTAPSDFADRGYTYKAKYTEDDPGTVADPDWVSVPLADADEDGIWTASTYHADGTQIWWKWVVKDGDDVVFKSGVEGPETLAAPGPYENDFAVCLKSWTWSPPELLTQIFDEITVSGFYKIGEGAYVEVPLVENAEGVFEAETIFECGTEIMYYFEVSGSYMGTEYYHFASAPAAETISGRATVENVFTEPQTLKSFELTACVEPAGGTYYAAWSLTGTGGWHEVALEPVVGEDCLYAGEATLYEGLSIYWKFYDAEWSTVVLGPEVLEGATMVNKWERTGVTRTIGYWGTHPCMAGVVLDEKLGGSIHIGWTSLDNLNEVMAVLNYPQMPGANKLSNYDKAVMQASRQLVGAILNTGFGTTPPTIDWYGTEMSIIDAALDALMSGDIVKIKAITPYLDEFNNSGDDEWLPDWKPECWNDADPSGAVAMGKLGWGAVKFDLDLFF